MSATANLQTGLTVKQAAELVSERMVYLCKVVLRLRPDLRARITDGRLSVNQAHRMARAGRSHRGTINAPACYPGSFRASEETTMKTTLKVATFAVAVITAAAAMAAENSATSPNGKPSGATGTSTMPSGGGGGVRKDTTSPSGGDQATPKAPGDAGTSGSTGK